MGPFIHLTEDQRLDRIAEILGKAIVRYWRRVSAAGDARAEPSTVAEECDSADDYARILAFLVRSGPATPRAIRHALGLSRTTTQRRLSQLVGAGRIVTKGHTRSALYLVVAGI